MYAQSSGVYPRYVKGGWSQDQLAVNFDMCQSVVSDYISTWAVFIDRALSTIFVRPTKSQILRSYPTRVVQAFDHAKISILMDCCDVETEGTAFRRALAALYSTYHHQPGVKFLVGTTPLGATPAEWIPDGFPSSVSGTVLRELERKTLIFSERVVPISPNASCVRSMAGRLVGRSGYLMGFGGG